MRNVLMAVLVLGLMSLPAFAQKAELFGGYQLTHVNSGATVVSGVPVSTSGTNINGWNASLTGNFAPFLGLTGDFSGVYKNGGKFHTYTFGPEVHVHAGGIKPFAHALFGGGTGSGNGVSETGLVMYYGGGLDVKIAPFVSARLAQVDWMVTRFSGVTEKNTLRFSAGLVLRF
jgi:hypothetical protein